MFLKWCLIVSLTLMSSTILMTVTTYVPVLSVAEKYFDQPRTVILFLTTCFNFFYVTVGFFLIKWFKDQYFWSTVICTVIIGLCAVGRYFAGSHYFVVMALTFVMAIFHVSIINAPYGLLKMFPKSQMTYVSAIPLFVPAIGINFVIFYYLQNISSGDGANLSMSQKFASLKHLTLIVSIVGAVATILSVFFMFCLKEKIENVQEPDEEKDLGIKQNEQVENKPQEEQKSFFQEVSFIWQNNRFIIIAVIVWGLILGIKWTYNSLFDIIFKGLKLTEKQTVLIGLCSNISCVIFCDLGAFIHNHTKISEMKIILALNYFGVIGSVVIAMNLFVQFLPVILLIFFEIMASVGFSSYLSLAFSYMQKWKLNTIVLSGIIFWMGNLLNLIGTFLLDKINTKISIPILILVAVIGIALVVAYKPSDEEDIRQDEQYKKEEQMKAIE